jgi:CP family cyanate transporter-like MFS transporter
MAAAFGGWRSTFVIVSAIGLVSVVAWLLLMPRDTGGFSAPGLPRLPWRRPAGWLLGIVFGSQSILFYGCVTWLAAIYVERGWGATEAGDLVALLSGIGLVATFAVPVIGDRYGTRRSQLAAAAALSVVGALVIAVTPGEPPGSPVAIAGTLLLGLGIGAYFPLALTLPVDVSTDPSEAASISALMLLVGYILAAISPVALGIVRDATGSFAVVVWILVAVSLAMIPLALSLSPARLRRAGGHTS